LSAFSVKILSENQEVYGGNLMEKRKCYAPKGGRICLDLIEFLYRMSECFSSVSVEMSGGNLIDILMFEG
jgi:hypothetical protein